MLYSSFGSSFGLMAECWTEYLAAVAGTACRSIDDDEVVADARNEAAAGVKA